MAYSVQTTDNKELKYDIRIPKRQELQQVIDLVNSEDWNYTVDLLTDVYDVNPEGFRAAVDTQGNVLSHCAFLPLDDQTSSVTTFFTRPEVRRKGIGKKLYDECLATSKGKNLIVNAAPEEKARSLYRRLDFKCSENPENRIETQDIVFPLKRVSNLTVKLESGAIVDYNDSMFEKVYQYDKGIQPIDRKYYVKNHIAESDVVKVALEDDKVTGYVCLRKNYEGFIIMPLYADSFGIAKQLLREVIKNVKENTKIKVGFLCGNPHASELFKAIGADKLSCGPMLKMYTKVDYADKIDQKRVYSVMNYCYALA